MTHAPDGVIAAGAPVGDATFTARFVRERSEAIRSAVQSLRDLQPYVDAQDPHMNIQLKLVLQQRHQDKFQAAQETAASLGPPSARPLQKPSTEQLLEPVYARMAPHHWQVEWRPAGP